MWYDTKWAEYGPPGKEIEWDPSWPMVIVGGPRDGDEMAVQRDYRIIHYPIQCNPTFTYEQIDKPQTFMRGTLRVEWYVLHPMAAPVKRLVDDSARDVLMKGNR